MLHKTATFVLLKPDATRLDLVTQVSNMIAEAGFRLALSKVIDKPDPEVVKAHFAHLEKRNPPAAERNINFLLQGPVIAAVYTHPTEYAIGTMRALIGPTDPAEASKDTIRGRFAHDTLAKAVDESRGLENIIHASDNHQTALEEFTNWFGNDYNVNIDGPLQEAPSNPIQRILPTMPTDFTFNTDDYIGYFITQVSLRVSRKDGSIMLEQSTVPAFYDTANYSPGETIEFSRSDVATTRVTVDTRELNNPLVHDKQTIIVRAPNQLLYSIRLIKVDGVNNVKTMNLIRKAREVLKDFHKDEVPPPPCETAMYKLLRDCEAWLDERGIPL